ncbi:odorant receptor 13a-like [Cotesia glomerata]|uniref:odorant receptor 13a-like n=1 Tax=Cotesia glomerata TaxID=32391 RepID=UPI001D023C5F|nr:odorant receptor 13a-like [Cotesia glomerata]
MIIVLVANLCIIIGETVAIKDCKDLTGLVKQINPICFHTIGLFKCICIFTNIDGINELISQSLCCDRLLLRLSRKKTELEEYKKIMTNFSRQIKKHSYTWLFFLMSTMFEWFIVPLFHLVYILAYQKDQITASLFEDHKITMISLPWKINNLLKYSLTFGFHLTNGVFSTLELWFSDMLHVFFLINICVNLKYFNRMMKKKNFPIENLKEFLIIHRENFELAEKIKVVFSNLLLITCLECMTALCLVSVETSTFKVNLTFQSILRLISLVKYWVGTSIELFIFCYLATVIDTLSTQSAEAIYDCNWEELVYNNSFNKNRRKEIIKKGKMIKFMLMRSQKHIIMTGRSISVFSMQSFETIVKFSLANALIVRRFAMKS